MDEAWGAVIAGIAAAIGGGLGGWVTARAAVKQALAAGREQQRNWLLDRRLAAYSDLLAAYNVLRERLQVLVEAQAQADPFAEPGDPPTPELIRAIGQFHEGREDLARAMQRIELVGPRVTMQPAVDGIRQAVDHVFQTRVGYNPDDHTDDERRHWLAAFDAFNGVETEFLDLANDVLHSKEI
ncbi:hypothetical protein OG864_00870 [Streptomyces sp. NBC_00124]|uniref:hypothetical protein n=1 Tax=Streptomyces sp. NBC_00124 TaxID=2975662 RepID=UPI00225C1F68|nr:hypothetical protein [Streptomyces sp. NBC_00124]MCX5357333.1 hypothetical protein [Streptomyces sp. NBC_00124]